MDDKELLKIGKDLNLTPHDIRLTAVNQVNSNDDNTSIITQDRLRKFNELFGND